MKKIVKRRKILILGLGIILFGLLLGYRFISRETIPLSIYKGEFGDSRDNPQGIRKVQGKYINLDSKNKLYKSKDLGISIIVPADYTDSTSANDDNSAYYERPNGDFAYTTYRLFRPLESQKDQNELLFVYQGINIYKAAVREDKNTLALIQSGDNFYDINNSMWSPERQKINSYLKQTNYKVSLVNIGNKKFIKVSYGLSYCYEGPCPDENIHFYTLNNRGDIYYDISYTSFETNTPWLVQKAEYEKIIKSIKIID
ncbi:MAG: hypothetical protein A2571_02155 [Candidatus Vogelbacteria bacterium RIFOXYD1_FULL_44_32]|uniref:Uncharacterized protein n=1 Tax=Candidatus Vogelbacteria bacterium RIFOXYD1_FULL_44_32 TaxID=1802438 RepID=A0A1G2QEX1_9BACT|nr:MAG: hypothetical protein A2571_02155 [Candidatus Vogelbacteria bacterium RIFOXYD1_FULL_44_32]